MKMNDNVKKVNNPLFNVAVTGGTLEDFSQHAILLPAKEKAPPPTLNISPDQLLREIIPNKSPPGTDEPIKFESFQNQIEPSAPPEPPLSENNSSNSTYTNVQTTASSTNFSSVFSSFSNILSIRPQSHAPKEEVVPPPAGIDSLIGQGNINPDPIPLFPTQLVQQPQPPPTQGPVNVFRRPGLKRPTYAPVPGLSNVGQASFPPPVQSQTSTVQSPPTAFPPPLGTPSSATHFTPIQPPRAVQPPFTAAQPPFAPVQPPLAPVQFPLAPVQPPLASAKSPLVGIQPPLAVAQPPAVVQPPLTVAQPPPAVVQSPLAVRQPPFAGVQPPLAVVQPPLAGVQPPFAVAQPPLKGVQPPLAAVQPPLAAVHPPLAVVQPPLAVVQPPLAAFEARTAAVQPPLTTVQFPSTATQPPSIQPSSASIKPQISTAAYSSVSTFQHHLPTSATVQTSTAFQPVSTAVSTAATVQSSLSTFQQFSSSFQPSLGNIPTTTPLSSHANPGSSFFEITPSAPPLPSNKGRFSHSNLPNQFKPISPLPPSVNAFSHIPQPHPTLPIPPSSQFLHHTFYSPGQTSLQSPVMAAIPASEALPSSNVNMVPPFPDVYATNNNVTESTAMVNQIYRPVYHHWFFQKEVESKKIWHPFSMVDSLALEQAFTSNDLDPDKVIATDGGRYDVNILRRQRTPVYWNGTSNDVRRCSWFHKGSPDGRLIPYEENVAARLEEEFRTSFEQNKWHKNVELATGEIVVFHGPDVLAVLPPPQAPDAWGNTPNQTRPRVVKRGMDEFDIDEGDPSHVDHILFLVHGIGSVCDLKFRTVEEVVDEFRNIALQLVQSHYRTSCEKGIVHRVEVLPISWHAQLHSDETGIDKQLKSITLESIPKLRDFTNDTLLDILFYTSPVYCQTIVSTVGDELNRIYDLFKQRNPSFKGGVSLGGHSLGSLILFDLLCHQVSTPEQDDADKDDVFPLSGDTKHPELKRRASRRISYMMGSVGTGQPQICYPHLNFEPKTFFAIGSPIGMFVIVRGLDTLGENFSLPTCPSFFNIFHPYDPIAYRIESLIHPELGKLKPVLIPHHKGRKRMHLELKETMARVGADLKQRVIESMKSTWNSFYQLAMFHKPDQPSIEEEVQKAFEEQIANKAELEEEPLQEADDVPHGSLNGGRRIDYILQEAPFEFINEYIFALTSHVCYWESEDTILLILKEIYSSMSISADNQIPQQTMTIERPPPSPTSIRSNKMKVAAPPTTNVGMDPTAPIQTSASLQPPPVSGFVRKT